MLLVITVGIRGQYSPSRSPRVHEAFVKQYGRNVCIRGVLPVRLNCCPEVL